MCSGTIVQDLVRRQYKFMKKTTKTGLNAFRATLALTSLLVAFNASAQCPQYRETQVAPDDVLWQENQLTLNRTTGAKLRQNPQRLATDVRHRWFVSPHVLLSYLGRS